MRRRWMFGAVAVVLVLGGGVLFLTERPLTVSVVQPERDVALRIYGLGARSRHGSSAGSGSRLGLP